MKLVSLNENVAAFAPSKELSEMEPDALINKLVTVKSWRGLIAFLKQPGVGRLLARRESDPLSGAGILSEGDYWYEPLWGHLNTWINKDLEIDYLDELTRNDLLASDDMYEVWVPELLSYAEDYRCLLTLAAVALGAAPAPEDMFELIDPADYIKDADAEVWFAEEVGRSFRKGANLSFLRFNAKYWPESEYGPYVLYEDECCFACKLGEKRTNTPDKKMGVLGFRIYCKGDIDLHLIAYDTTEKDEETVRRIACGLIVAPTIGNSTQEETSFEHDYADMPEEAEGAIFSLKDGFSLARDGSRFTTWQHELTHSVEDAVLSGHVTLCRYCGTPIITRGTKDRVEYCCNSHKTSASKQRRERAIALCLRDVPLEKAIEEIGDRYAESITKWYAEARELGNMF